MKAYNFNIREIKENHIIVEEEDDERKRILPFWFKYGKIIQLILVFLTMLLFTIGVGMTVYNAYNNSSTVKNVKGEVILESTDEFQFGQNFFPVKEEDALALFYPTYFKSDSDLDLNGKYKPKDIKIINTGSIDIIYNIVVEEINITNPNRLNPNVLRYRCTDVTNSNIKESIKYSSDVLTKEKFKGIVYDSTNPDGYTPENYYVLSSGNLEAGHSVNYSIIAWLDYTKEIDLSVEKKFEGKIKVIFDYEK